MPIAIFLFFMTEKEDLEARFDKARHDLINVLQGIGMHNDLALEAAKACDGLHRMEIGSCFVNLDMSWKEARTMVELADKYVNLIDEMRKLAYAYFQRYPVQHPQ